MSILPINLAQAELATAVANTPIFLVKRLRENPDVSLAYEIHGSEKIFAALEASVRRKPESMSDIAEVYFYLVALSYEKDLQYLRRAAELKPRGIKWYSDIADFLWKSARPTAIHSITLSTPSAERRLVGAVSNSASASIGRIILASK